MLFSRAKTDAKSRHRSHVQSCLISKVSVGSSGLRRGFSDLPTAVATAVGGPGLGVDLREAAEPLAQFSGNLHRLQVSTWLMASVGEERTSWLIWMGFPDTQSHSASRFKSPTVTLCNVDPSGRYEVIADRNCNQQPSRLSLSLCLSSYWTLAPLSHAPPPQPLIAFKVLFSQGEKFVRAHKLNSTMLTEYEENMW